MDKTTARAVRRIDRIAQMVEELPLVGAEEYANGGFRGKPIVDRHYTAGNQGRYGWKNLSQDYAEWKAEHLVVFGKTRGKETGLAIVDDDDLARIQGLTGKARKAALVAMTKGRKTSTLNDSAGGGGGTRLPMLVLTGRLRTAINSRSHLISKMPDGAMIVFRNLPHYAVYHHKGQGVPRRSPVNPNAEDIKAIADTMRRYLDKVLGTGGDVPISQTSIPGRARFSNPLARK